MDEYERMWDEFICRRQLGGCGYTYSKEFPRSIAKNSTPRVLADLRNEDREFKKLPMKLRSPVKGRRIDEGLWKRPMKRSWFYGGGE
jgi:hypothetical protein